MFDMFDQWVRLTSLLLFLGFVEERAPVRIGITDPIVAIEVQRACDAAIVSIAQQFGTTQTVHGGSTGFHQKAPQRYTFISFSTSQRALFNSYFNNYYKNRRTMGALSGGGAVAPVCFALRAFCAPITILVFRAEEGFR